MSWGEERFHAVGKVVAFNPWTTIICSLVVVFATGSGFFVALESENRPDKQWVPKGSPSLAQGDYVKQTWPSSQRFSFYIAKCKGENCNIFDSKYIKELYRIHEGIMNVTVDAEKVWVEDKLEKAKVDKTKYDEKFGGKWSFQISADTKRKCFQFGPFCGKQSILDVFRDDGVIINDLTDATALQAINFWENQTTSCPVTIARDDSPCVDTSKWMPGASKYDCQLYKTVTQRENCRNASTAYCDSQCPTICFTPPGSDSCRPMKKPGTTCKDEGCLTLQVFSNMNTSSTGNGTGAPDSAFSFEPFKIKTAASAGLGGPVSVNGKFTSAKTFFGFYALGETKMLISGSERDPIAETWEKKALCVLGINANNPQGLDPDGECPKSDLLEFDAQFSRSLSDEFGGAIRGDVPKVNIALFLIVIYAAIMLSRQKDCGDHVHTMMGMAFVAALICGFSYFACVGLGGYFGLKNNNLNGNIPFLLLGLGVDDAFVLASEYKRAGKNNPKMSIEDRVALACKYGGMSILITSATDALAFLVGSATVLPALSWFCQFSGIGVIFCFTFQITIFLPCLVINARREEATRLDCCCCMKTGRDNTLSNEETKLEKVLRKFANLITSTTGTVVTLLIFAAFLAVGVLGMTKIYKDFKLEWFLPDDSYVNTFIKANDQYFQSGVPVTIYVEDINYFEKQDTLIEMHKYMTKPGSFFDPNEDVNDWYQAFMDTTRNGDNAASWLNTAQTKFTDKAIFYAQLHSWYKDGGGARYRTFIKWSDSKCDVSETWDNCNPGLGVKATKMGGTIMLKYTLSGDERYKTLDAMRTQIKAIEEKAFPYSFNFAYWEEVGIIDVELTRNLIICAAVVIVMIGAMIPHPRIAVFVMLSIILSVVDLVGFLYFWGVTISSISTIYILISVGLAVDYSAHIAHMFASASGTGAQRAEEALVRIGPCVFNAITSTMLAVVVLSTSNSFIFRVFFKALFLTVLFGGLHGMWLLPTLLSLFGGEKEKVSPRVDEKDLEAVRSADVEMTSANMSGGGGPPKVTMSR